MDEYFIAVNTSKKAYMKPSDYNVSSAIMEHIWIYNPFVMSVEKMLTIKGSWYKSKISWIGNYNDLYAYTCNNYKKIITKVALKENNQHYAKYLYNHTKKQFVDKSKVPVWDGWSMHPLPLLTCINYDSSFGDFLFIERNQVKFIGS